ncbi:MAG: hypothetical protein ACREHG_04240 [Candidatus Saccharimonadales bacterium]
MTRAAATGGGIGPTNLTQWAHDMEVMGGLPSSDTNALIAWGQAEGGAFHNTAHFNVLNTTLPETGSHSVNATGVQAYTSWTQGVAADLATLRQSNMQAIDTALHTNPSRLPTALASDPWGTNPATVAKLMGESPTQIHAMGTAGGSGGTGGTGTSLTIGHLFGLPISFTKSTMVRGALIVFGIIVLLMGLHEITSPSHDATQTIVTPIRAGTQKVKRGAKKTGEAAGAAAVA